MSEKVFSSSIIFVSFEQLQRRMKPIFTLLGSPMSNRRQFLASSAAAVTMAALPSSLFAERMGGKVFTNASLGAYAQGTMTQETFEGVVGSSFKIFLDDFRAAQLRLLSVTPLGAAAATATNNAAPVIKTRASVGRGTVAPVAPPKQQVTGFYLTFSIVGEAFPQDSYLLDHGTLGRFAVFLVPGGTGNCTATFCQLTS
jgi:hypothetical protein